MYNTINSGSRNRNSYPTCLSHVTYIEDPNKKSSKHAENYIQTCLIFVPNSHDFEALSTFNMLIYISSASIGFVIKDDRLDLDLVM